MDARGQRTDPAPHLSLDLSEPVNGWELALSERGVEIIDDDLGRSCVHREVLGDLLREERERLARIEAEGAAAVAAPLPSGIPALEDGSWPLASIMAGDLGYKSPVEEFGRP
jgi:hypothetical protein